MTAVTAPTTDPADATSGLTAEREETKYLVDLRALHSLVAALRSHLPVHRHVSGGAVPLPDPQHYTTTIYLDTPSRAHFRAALADPTNNVKIRAREYYDVHPSLAELATDAAQVIRYEPFMWFELKRRNGLRTTKLRFRLPKKAAPGFFGSAESAPDGALPGAEAFSVWGTPDELREVSSYRQALGEPLSPSSVVNYRRVSFQNEAETLRVTVDVEIAFFAPPPGLWTTERALVRSSFGRPSGREPRGLIEVKRRGASVPVWLTEALATSGAEVSSFSKFEHAEHAVRPNG